MFSSILINFSSKIVKEYLSTEIERVLEHRNCNNQFKVVGDENLLLLGSTYEFKLVKLEQ